MTPIGAIKVSSDTGYVGMGFGWPLHSLRDSLQGNDQKLASKSSYVLMRYTRRRQHWVYICPEISIATLDYNSFMHLKDDVSITL